MRQLSLLFFILLALSGCRDKIICPAFQSTYILDDETRAAYYSYVWKLDGATRDQYLASAAGISDSTGNIGTNADNTLKYYDYVAGIIQPREQVRRSKYGIVKYEPMWMKNYKLRTAPKENVLGPEPEKPKTEKPIDIGEFVASDFSDSLMTDSTSMFAISDSLSSQSDTLAVAQNVAASKPKKKEVKYLYRYDPDSLNNAEQEYYNKYFGYLLIDESASRAKKAKVAAPASEKPNNEVVPVDSTQQKPLRKGIRLRKNKESENEQTPEPTENEEQESETEGGN